MATKNVKVKISQKGADKAARGLKRVDSSLVKLGKSSLLVAGGYFGAMGLIAAFKGAIDAAGRQEQAEKKLATALGHTNKSLLAQASAFQQQSKFGDEALIEMMALASNMGIAEDQIAETTKMAIGLSEALNVDMTMAMKAAAGAIQGDTNMLTRYIPELKTTTDQTEKLAIVQRAANKGFEQSKTSVDTMAGSLNQAGMAIGDASESLGGLLAPVVITVAKSVKLLAEGIGAVSGAFNGFIGDAERAAKDATILKGFRDNTIAVEDFKKGLTELSDVGLAGLALEYEATAGSALLLTQGEKDRADEAKLIFDEYKAREESKNEATKANAEKQEFLNSLFIRGEEGIASTTLKEIDLAAMREKFNADNKKAMDEAAKLKEDALVQDLRFAALSGQSAKNSAKSVIRAESMEAVVGLIASILKYVPFPFNTILAAGAGTTATALIDKGLSQFAKGGDFITDGPQMIMVGDNSGGRERVQVTPLSSPNLEGPSGGININFNGPVTNDSYVRDFIIPEIQKQTRLNLA